MIETQSDINLSIIQRFAALHKKNCLAHAYLFVGTKEAGKSETAVGVAKWFNCEKAKEEGFASFCDQCLSCRKINSKNHPDVHMIEGDYEKSIKVEEIRQLLSQIKLRPFLAEKKIFIIKNMENLTLEGSNALLKTLEEPSTNSLLILTSSVPEKVLDTVKSRCHVVPFLPLSQKELMAKVSENGNGNPEIQFMTYFAEGCVGRFRKLQENHFFTMKNESIDRFILNPATDENFTKKVLVDKQATKDFLDVLLSWVRDAMLIKSGVEDERLIHLDRRAELRDFQRRFSFEALTYLQNAVIKMFGLLSENFNVKMRLVIIKNLLRSNYA